MYLTSIARFRAIAILLIVAGHGFPLAAIAPQDLISGTLANLITGGTTLFVCISGYMFHHVFAHRFAFRRFITAKLRTILLPYLALCVPITCYFVIRNPEFASETLGQSAAPLQIGKVIVTGALFQAYWFAPFILCMFLMSPLHLRFLGLAPQPQALIIIAGLIAAVLVHRPVANLNPLQSLIYFTPAYLCGLCASRYRAALLRRLREQETALLAAALLLALVQTGLGQQGNLHSAALSWSGIDLMLPQKLLLSLAIFALLERGTGPRLDRLRPVSETSFSIFFLHPVALILIEKAGTQHPTGLAWINLLWITAQAVGFSMALALSARRLLGRRSRFLLGY
ncbi:acyltransferase family protein [Pseudodonghicola flavimaris]|uniref:Acyltransferase n=1 Tax=Pseudodonghicola flavimaris TaxID=3050036 RepID=A0ABT7F2V0_9RHOB|nr:acyltransferase [Pseudodonghicola flavimaris]MDK3018952.1 acyltransferase [Pseudodonghicola flavimaris]